MHADCQTGGHAPRDTTDPLETLTEKLGVQFRLCRGLCICTLFLFSPCLVCLHKWVKWKGLGEDEKMFRACYCSPSLPIHWRFKFYVTLICLGFQWRISIFRMDFLRGNRFRLKTRCEFYVWTLCCGFREFQYLARPSKISPESGIKG